MNIVIAGAGQVGTHLARMLSSEKHNIVLLDNADERLRLLDGNSDVMTMNGSPMSISDLYETGIKTTDLFIAVTPYESENISACILAKNLGAEKTVARIDNYEYFRAENLERFRSFGIDSLIYPEMLAAQEIVQSLKMPGIRQLYEFEEGKLIMAGFKIRENSPIINKPLHTMDIKSENFRIMAITRGPETFIPTAHDSIQNGDIVYFITPQNNMKHLKEKAGKGNFDVKNVMILGGSRIGVKTAQFAPESYNIKIIETDRERGYKLVDQLDNALVIHGDGRNLELLKEEGIERMDAFVALTGSSETNILSSILAKRLGVKKTVAEVENIDFLELAENFNIGTIINKKRIAASHIYQLTLSASINTVKCITASRAEVIELTAMSGSKITRELLKDLKISNEVNIGAIIRGDQIFIAHGDIQILAGDRVIVFCLESGIGKIEKYFA